MTFGDNDKAIFGAGSDLQIYHDGSNSYVKDNGTGDLYLQGESNVRITNASGQQMFLGQNGAGANLYYAGANKLYTTSTGIDVTGTVTADGLTVDGDATISSNNGNSLTLNRPDGAGSPNILFQSNGTQTARLVTDASNNIILERGTTDALKIDGATGDISFYEDTGTTPKFFWDASAESLGIGTTSPSSYWANADDLVVSSSGSTGISVVSGTASTGYLMFADSTAPGDTTRGGLGYDHSTNSMLFRVNNDTKMTIDSSGRVGIGTSSPSYNLHIEGSTNGLVVGKVVNTNTGASARADMGVVSDGADITMIATSAAYTGVSGWADSGIISTSSGSSGGMLFNVQASAPYRFMQGATNERMRIDSSGNVGIGTSSPSYPLSVKRTTDGTISYFDGSTTQFVVGVASSVINLNAQNGNATMAFQTNGAERMRITSSGNVGIGTSSPADLLHVNGNARVGPTTGANLGTGGFLIFGTRETASESNVPFITQGSFDGNAQDLILGTHSSTGTVRFFTGASSGSVPFTSTNDERMRINSSGYVGIGTSNPQDVLDLGASTSGRGIAWGGTAGTAHYNTIWSEYSSAALVLGSGLKGNKTVEGFLAPYTGTYGYSAIELDGIGERGIKFYAGPDAARTKDASVSPTEVMRIDTYGHVIAPYGVTLGTAAGTYSAANTLDDYEEGQWYPSFETSDSNFSGVIDVSRGGYVKIGRVVHLSGYLRTDSVGGTGTYLFISNLPFTVTTNTNQFTSGLTVGWASTWNTLPTGGYTADNSTLCYLTSATGAYLTVSDMGTTANDNYLIFQLTYFTDA